MARNFQRPEQTYPAGEYGPFSIDSFTNANTDRLEATMTVVGWPVVDPLMVVDLAWDTGVRASFGVGGAQPGAVVKFGFSIPKDGGVKKQVAGGSIKVTTFAPITTAITLTAV